jgi:hypothetical protein
MAAVLTPALTVTSPLCNLVVVLTVAMTVICRAETVKSAPRPEFLL